MESDLDRGLERLNALLGSEAEAELHKCCASTAWASKMATERPFATEAELIATADEIWWALKTDDWLEAFRSHPKIGEKKAEVQITPEAQKWSEQEQLGINNAARTTTLALAGLNREYEEKFGYIYIICATGKSSEEMLAILRERLKHDPVNELRVAAEEQSHITRLRLKKLLEQ